MSRFHDKWKYSEYVPEGISLNGREFLVTPENGDASGKDDIALVVHEKDARLIAAAPEMYKLLKRVHWILSRFGKKGIIDTEELASIVRKSALLLNRINAEEDEE